MLWEVRRSLRAADLVRVLNQQERRYCVEALKIPAERVVVRPNGISPPGPQPVSTPGGSPRVAAIGRWEELKGSVDLARAMTELLLQDRAARLSLLGTGVDYKGVHAAFPRVLHPRITVVPQFQPSALDGLLDGHQLYVSMSHSEGFSLALVEALARGLVPVVTDVGAAPDLLGASGCGTLVRVGAVEDCTAACLSLLSDRVSLMRHGQLAQRIGARLSAGAASVQDLRDYSQLRPRAGACSAARPSRKG